MKKLALKIFLPLVGKNAASFWRSLATGAGGAMVAAGVLSEQQTADGLQLEELVLVGGGLALAGLMRFLNFKRAELLPDREVDAFGEWLGPLVGRSLPSFARAVATFLAGAIAATGVMKPEEALGADVGDILAALTVWGLARVSSYLQEGKGKDKGKQAWRGLEDWLKRNK